MTAAFRVRLLASCLVVVGIAFVQDPGLVVADTKFDLVAAPGDFLSRALHLWDGEGAFGQLQNQAYGYLWPMGPFFLLGSLLDLPGWAVQRLWVGVVMAVALAGAARVSRALGVRSDLACLVAGFAFALSPRLLTTLGPISIEAWPGALAPWVLLPLVRGATEGSPRRAAAWSALAVAMVGGVNAAATFAVLPLGVVWLLTRTPGPRRRALMLWWPVFTLLGTLWWLVPLFLMGAYSPPFLDYIETTSVTTFPTTLFDVLRGTSNWVPYVSVESRAGNDLVTTATLVLNSGVVLLLGVAGLALRRTPHRSFLVLSVLVGVLMVGAGHTGDVEGWWAADVRGLLDGALAPLRNVHKFDPVLRLPLVIGLALFLDRVLARSPADDREVADRGDSVVHARLEQVNRVAVVAMVVAVVAGAALPAALGRITPAGATTGAPTYWEEAATWLDEADERDPGGTDLLVPGSGFADYVWGVPRDEPLQWLADSPWAVRNVIPLARPGSIRMLDAIEERLAQGAGSAALVSYLRRAGVEHLVVRNDLSRGSDVPDPVLVHEALSESPGLERVAAFGPLVGGDPLLDEDDDADEVGEDDAGGRVLVNGGWQSRYPAVEVFAVPDSGDFAVSASEPVVVAGGPEDLLDLARLDLVEDAPTVLTADGAELLDSVPPGSVVLTDGLRARERSFARLHDGASPVLAPGDRRSTGNPARDYRLDTEDRWSTTARLEGAAAVVASGSASDASAPGGTRRGELPFAAVDGDVSTAWVGGAGQESRPSWRVELESPLAGGVEVGLVGGAGAPRDQQVRVRTQGGAGEPLRLGPGEEREVTLPEGETTWVQVEDASGAPGRVVALAEVDVPGLEVTRRLVLPGLPPDWGNPAAVVLRRDRDDRKGCAVLGRDVRCVPGRDRPDEEGAGLSRAFALAQESLWDAGVTLVPRGGPELDRLALVDQPVAITTSSTAVPDPRAGAVAAVDGNAGTTWIADVDDLRPALELAWLGRRAVDSLAITLDETAAARAPTSVRLTWPDGRRTVALDDDGSAEFAPIRTDRLTVTVLDAERASDVGFDASATDLGVGVTELGLGGVDYLPLGLSEDVADFACGTGPDIVIAGDVRQTALVAAPGALARGAVVEARLCDGAPILLPDGEVRVDVYSTPAVGIDALVLRPRDVVGPIDAAGGVWPAEWSRTADSRTIDPVPSSGLVVLRQNSNPGWEATRDGDALEGIVVDGWQQGWLLPPDGAQTPVEASFVPDRAYRWGLLGGLVAALALLGVLVATRRDPSGVGAPSLSGREVPGFAMVGVALLSAGLVAGWAGVGVAAAVTGAVRLLDTRRPELVPWAVSLPCLVVAAAYAVTPWGSSDGWAGSSSWTVYLMLVPLVGLLVAGRGRWLPTSLLSRMAGRSTAR